MANTACSPVRRRSSPPTSGHYATWVSAASISDWRFDRRRSPRDYAEIQGRGLAARLDWLPSWRINVAQRSSSGKIVSALPESKLTTRRETPSSRSRLSRSRFSLAPQIVIGTDAGSRPASMWVQRSPTCLPFRFLCHGPCVLRHTRLSARLYDATSARTWRSGRSMIGPCATIRSSAPSPSWLGSVGLGPPGV